MGHSSPVLSHRPFFLIVMLWSLIGLASAQHSTLARHFTNSAAPFGDCDIESGEMRRMPLHQWGLSFDPSIGARLGEAGNPGPPGEMEEIYIGTTNPSGLRSKEALAVQMGPGVWTLAETQLSSFTQTTSKKAIKFHARMASRQIHCHFGAPVPLRSRSTWAGGYGGVATLSDWSSSHYNLRWPDSFWDSSRVLVTQHLIGNYPVLVCSIYGFPRGPTYPQSRSLTDRLLEFITQQVAYGYSGLAVIQGDFNHCKNDLQQTKLWHELGWRSAQDIAAARWNHEVQPTCKGATERDYIFISPALQQFMTSFELFDTFMEHSSLRAGFCFPSTAITSLAWPLPSKIPWQELDLESWHSTAQDCPQQTSQDSTQFFKEFSTAWEASLSGHFLNQSQQNLEQPQRGRGQRTSPTTRSIAPPRCKASRPGEAALACNTAGEAVILWFKQLRRLQSYMHSIKKGQNHLSAITYRTELWSAIRKAAGFEESFPVWWEKQEFASETGPLPFGAPELLQAADIYHFYHVTFRRFEAWHQNWRNKQLRTKFENGMDALYKSLKDPPRDSVLVHISILL